MVMIFYVDVIVMFVPNRYAESKHHMQVGKRPLGGGKRSSGESRGRGRDHGFHHTDALHRWLASISGSSG